MPEVVTFWIDIIARPQERVRFKSRGWGKNRKMVAYTPERTKEFQDTVRQMVRQFMQETGTPEFPKSMPVELAAIFYLERPKSAKKRVAPFVRPDLSNYLKSCEDALQRAVRDQTPALLEDDSSICRIVTEKRYVDEDYPEPGILISIREWSPDD